jgi:hypothetical protein
MALLVLCLALPHVVAGEPVRLSAGEFDRLVEQLHVKNQPWASIPWQTNVTEARRLAASQQKPIFLVVNTGNCLGYT